MKLELIEDRKNKKILIKLLYANQRIKNGLRAGLFQVGVELVKEAKNIIKNSSKTGRTYTYKGKRYNASAPGEAPAIVSRKLIKKITFTSSSWSHLEFGDKAKHGVYVEEGTRNMEPRPHLIVAIENKNKDTKRTLLEFTDKAIKK